MGLGLNLDLLKQCSGTVLHTARCGTLSMAETSFWEGWPSALALHCGESTVRVTKVQAKLQCRAGLRGLCRGQLCWRLCSHGKQTHRQGVCVAHRISRRKEDQNIGASHGQEPSRCTHKLTQPLKKAVYGVLPKNNLRRVWMSRLYLFRDDNHAYAANALQDHEGASVPAVCISQVSKKDQQGSPADLPNNQ